MGTCTLPQLHSNFGIESRPSFKFQCQASPLNLQTLRKKPSFDSTRTHLANLEKLLQTNHSEQPSRPDPVEKTERRSGPNICGLDLARIWPAMKSAGEEIEMSPRHLARLQRLLSITPQCSPRDSLASRWREYHGCNDWSGLLDPLDHNLRREVVRYGEFIQSAYRAFNSDPEMPTTIAPELPDKAYSVTKSLYATASVGLPKWVDRMAPDLGWMTQRSSWVGYVAVCEDQKEIKRMGRRDIVIALRGTSTCLEWVENFRNVLVPLPEDEDNPNTTHAQSESKVECGFLSLHKTPGARVQSLAESVTSEIRRLIKKYDGESLSITVTGHSLGAALSLLVADELSCIGSHPPIAVFSFGGPRVGNRGFARRLAGRGVKVLRVVNSADVITRVPGVLVSEGVGRALVEAGVDERVVEAVAYSHVGEELRVDTKMSPFLKPDADVGCCHDLEAYLHLVDGFWASGCPFRTNAKRSLVKLLDEQGGNMKKLYTSKAQALNLEKGGRGFINARLPRPT